jgi:hypothetical protein
VAEIVKVQVSYHRTLECSKSEKAKKPRLRGCERLRAAEEEELAEGAAGTVLYAVATFRYRSDIAAKFSCRVTADQQLAINQSQLTGGRKLPGGLVRKGTQIGEGVNPSEQKNPKP